MYSMLKELRICSPDTFTFSSMFLLYQFLHSKTIQKLYDDNLTSPFSLMVLYCDFMLAVKLRGHMKGIVLMTTLMNIILRAFIQQCNYVGTFIILNWYLYFNVPLDHQTYYHVVKHVMHRIWLEVTKQHVGR